MAYKTSAIDRINIVNEYIYGNSIRSISLKYGISYDAVYNLLRRRNVNIENRDKRKYYVDDNYFDNIDSEEKAYILGFLYADGYNNTERNYIEITLHKKDAMLLNRIRMSLKSNSRLIKTKDNNGKYNHIRLVITSRNISKKLEELGCIKAKTFKIEFPYLIDKSLYSHFIRGYFDGDGCISLYRKTDCEFSITGTRPLLEEIQKILISMCGLNITKFNQKRKDSEICTLRYCGRKNMLKIFTFMYKDSTIFLDRKYKKFLEVRGIEE